METISRNEAYDRAMIFYSRKYVDKIAETLEKIYSDIRDLSRQGIFSLHIDIFQGSDIFSLESKEEIICQIKKSLIKEGYKVDIIKRDSLNINWDI